MMLFFFLLLSPLTLRALTPVELREAVIRNFPLLEEARMKQQASEAAVTSAEGNFDHKLKFKSRNRIEDKYENQYFETTVERDTGLRGIDLIAGHRQGSGLFAPYDGKYDTSAAGEIFAGLSVPLLRDSSTDQGRTNLALKQLTREQSKEELFLKQNIYVHKALSLYYKWIAEDRILRINREILELAKKREDMLQVKFRRGDVEKVKLTDNERSIDKRQAEILKSEAKLRGIEAVLRLYVDDLSSVSDLTEDVLSRIEAPNFTDAFVVDETPQIKILTIEKKKNSLQRALAEQSRLPGLGIDVLGARELSGRNVPYDPDRLQVGVRFDFPLENRKAEGKTVEQEFKLRALEKRLLYTERELRSNYEATLKIIQLTHERFLTTTSEAKRTRIMAQAESTRFRMGGSDLFIMNLRELDVTDAEIRRWTSWYDFHQAVLDAKLYRNQI